MKLVEQIIAGNKHRLFYLTASDGNLDYWYFMFVQPSKLSVFRKFQAGENLELTEFGDIIRCGHGESAPSSIIEEINQKYGSNF